MLKKDSIGFGALIGLVLPLLFYGILALISSVIEPGTPLARPFEPDRMLVFALVINIIPIRVYFVNWKLDKTGRGILLATFLLMITAFVFMRYC